MYFENRNLMANELSNIDLASISQLLGTYSMITQKDPTSTGTLDKTLLSKYNKII